MATNLEVYRGDDKTYNVVFKDGEGEVINITGWEVFFTVKNKATDTDAQAIIQKKVTSHTDPTNGETEISLTHDDTDITVKYYDYDIQIKDADSKIKTIVVGQFKILQDVTFSES